MPFRRYESLPESFPSTNDTQNLPCGEGGQGYKTGSVTRQGSQGARPQMAVEPATSMRPLPPPPKGLSSHEGRVQVSNAGEISGLSIGNQGARPRKPTSSATDTQEHQG